MFNENYNNALWLMLAGEKPGRETIVKIMQMIPKELFSKIEHMIKNYASVGLYEPVSYHGVVDDTGDKLFLNVTILDDEQLCLFIRTVPVADSDFILDEYCIELLPVDVSELADLKHGSRVDIGRVEHLKRKCKDVFNTEEENCIIQMKFDKIYSCSRNLLGSYVHVNTDCTVRPLGIYEDYSLSASKRVNLDKIPTKMYPHQFDNEKRLNRLVKGRKKNKYHG